NAPLFATGRRRSSPPLPPPTPATPQDLPDTPGSGSSPGKTAPMLLRIDLPEGTAVPVPTRATKLPPALLAWLKRRSLSPNLPSIPITCEGPSPGSALFSNLPANERSPVPVGIDGHKAWPDKYG